MVLPEIKEAWWLTPLCKHTSPGMLTWVFLWERNRIPSRLSTVILGRFVTAAKLAFKV